MARTPFSSARSKIERANHHINEFQRGIAKLPSMGICDVFPDVTPAGEHCLSVYAHQLPSAFSLIMGDCVNCLRSSLDHVATQIVAEISQKDGALPFPNARNVG